MGYQFSKWITIKFGLNNFIYHYVNMSCKFPGCLMCVSLHQLSNQLSKYLNHLISQKCLPLIDKGVTRLSGWSYDHLAVA